jgi:hypothetical protein
MVAKRKKADIIDDSVQISTTRGVGKQTEYMCKWPNDCPIGAKAVLDGQPSLCTGDKKCNMQYRPKVTKSD